MRWKNLLKTVQILSTVLDESDKLSQGQLSSACCLIPVNGFLSGYLYAF